MTWPQRRPPWCPHADCRFQVHSQDKLCLGELPEPDWHGGGRNTHRMCIQGDEDDGGWHFEMTVNRGDMWAFWRLLSHVFGFGSRERKLTDD